MGILGFSYFLPHESPPSHAPDEIYLPIQYSVDNKIKRGNNKIHCSTKHALTQRQLDCLYYLVLGNTAKEIASILGLSRRTIEHYLGSLKLKYSCKSRSDLISLALQMKSIWNKLLQDTPSNK